MRNVFVTGANSFLATLIIKLLLRQGYRVTGYLRNLKNYRGGNHQHLNFIEGYFTDFDAIRAKILECHAIIHVEAITQPDDSNTFDYDKINVEGSKNLLYLATRTSIQAFIYISSANAIGHGTKSHPGTEICKVQEPFLSCKYAQSKIKAQDIVLNWPATFSRIVIAPTFTLGPGAYYSSASQEIILRSIHKKFIFCPPGCKNIVHVDDVAVVVLSALKRAHGQSVYLAANENVSYLELWKKLLLVSGQ